MRIVGGLLAKRKIEPPLSLKTRPMMDRVREALFNVLMHRDFGIDVFEQTYVLDAFCGTGALAFECLSRGAAQATLFDHDREAVQIARQNAASLGLTDNCRIMLADALNPPKSDQACQVVFLAPPYGKDLIPATFEALDTAGWIAPDAVIVAETGKKEKLDLGEKPQLVLARSYGIARLHFYKR